MTAWLLTDAEVGGQLVDVRIDGGDITAVGRGVERRDATVIDAGGAALLPGLHDHHVHLLAMAARAASLDLDPCDTPDAADGLLAAAPVNGAWLRVAGYDEHRHGPLDRDRLDRIVGATAVRVQHRSGLSWVVSSEGLRRLGVDDSEAGDGWLHRRDDLMAERIPHEPPSLASIGAGLARVGITGVTEATARIGTGRLDALRAATVSGHLTQRIVVLGADETDAVAGWAELGPAKLLADEQLGLDPDALASLIGEHHRAGRAVAIHAVSRAETVTAVSALHAAGPIAGDRIEHGSVLPTELDGWLAAGGVTIVVQPSLVAERGDHHLAEVDADDLGILHRHASLLAAGIRVAAGSDAPVTTVDPWAAIATAATRRTRSGDVVGPRERVPAATALAWYLGDPLDPGGPPRRVRRGARADLCLLDVPLSTMLAAPDACHVRGTWVAGERIGS